MFFRRYALAGRAGWRPAKAEFLRPDLMNVDFLLPSFIKKRFLFSEYLNRILRFLTKHSHLLTLESFQGVK